MLIWSRKWDGYPLLSKTWQQTSPGNSVYQKMEISLRDFPVPSVVTRGLKAAIFQGREALKEVLEQWRLRGSWSGESVFQRCSGIQWDGFDQKSREPWGSENPLPTWNQLFVWTFEPSVFFLEKLPALMCWSNSFPGAPTLQLASLLICKWVFESTIPKWSFLLNSCFTLKPWSKLNCKNRYRKFHGFPRKWSTIMVDFPHPDPAKPGFYCHPLGFITPIHHHFLGQTLLFPEAAPPPALSMAEALFAEVQRVGRDRCGDLGDT